MVVTFLCFYERDISFIVDLSEELKKRGVEVRIFFMNEAVRGARKIEGIMVSGCSRNAKEFGVDMIDFGSQYDLSVFVSQSDIFLAFT